MILFNLFFTFVQAGLFTVGSGYSMLVLAQRYVVDNHRWLTPDEFADVVAIAEVTPGPIIINLATFVGTRIAGVRGAIAATAGVVFVPFLCILIISLHYDKFINYPAVQRIFKVIRPMAVGFITVAIINLSHRSINNLQGALIAIVVILVTYVLKINPAYTVLGGVLFGLFFIR